MPPKNAVAGVAHPDCILLYDFEGKPVVHMKDKKDNDGNVVQSARCASANLYVGIERNLLDAVDPVLDAAISRLEKIYSETFWAIPAAFTLGQACLALAKRGLNVNQITLYLGPGGVGLSKYTAHLEAMLGTDNHDIFDPNIFYSDDELRKQVPGWQATLSLPVRSGPPAASRRSGRTCSRSSPLAKVLLVACLTAF